MNIESAPLSPAWQPHFSKRGRSTAAPVSRASYRAVCLFGMCGLGGVQQLQAAVFNESPKAVLSQRLDAPVCQPGEFRHAQKATGTQRHEEFINLLGLGPLAAAASVNMGIIFRDFSGIGPLAPKLASLCPKVSLLCPKLPLLCPKVAPLCSKLSLCSSSGPNVADPTVGSGSKLTDVPSAAARPPGKK